MSQFTLPNDQNENTTSKELLLDEERRSESALRSTNVDHPSTSSSSSDEEEEPIRNRWPSISLQTVVVYAFAIWGVVSLATSWIGTNVSHVINQEFLTSDVSCNCGNSIEDAISLGCRYDTLASAWLPAACQDVELTAEFDAWRNAKNESWDYFADEKGLAKLSIAEVSRLADVPDAYYWTTHEWHIVHCVFYWRKLQRSPYTGVRVEGRYDSDGHILHCLNMFLLRDSLGSVGTRSGVSTFSDRI